jgi:ribosomal protein S18 acetylase RimI-like enzyme
MLAIRPAQPGDFEAFFAYLDEHLAGNGRDGAPMFQPLPRAASFLPPERQSSFREGAQAAVGTPGWRRLWLAWDGDRIAGHIDLRARPEAAAAHRCLLGMGVHEPYRRAGLGRQLLDTVLAWAAQQGFVWVDLEVLSANAPAIALYARAGFLRTGATADMFRIDGESLAYTFMSRRVPA